MNCLPVVEMEMRSASRRQRTFGVRLLFALTGVGTYVVVLSVPHLSPSQKGQTMLVVMSFLSLAFCLVAGGFLTADCISSEKREGTLGLLFLTPLTGMDIVLGKLACRGLQLFYGIWAVFPVFFLALLTGGVTWAEVIRILLALVVVLVLSASIGMFISVLGTESRSTVLATFTSVFLTASIPVVCFMLWRVFLPSASRWNGLLHLSPVFTVLAGFDSSYRGYHGPATYWRSLAVLLGLSGMLIVASGFLLVWVFRALGTRCASTRTSVAPLASVSQYQRNPYEWIIRRSSAKAHSLGILTYFMLLFFVVMLVVSLSTTHWREAFSAAFCTGFLLHLTVKLRLAVEASRQINLDRQSGALELLLATPLAEDSILESHLGALRAFARSSLVMLVSLNLALELSIMLFSDKLHMGREDALLFHTLFIGGAVLAGADFGAMRWLALWHGLRASSHIRAALLTFSWVMIPSWIGMGVVIALIAGPRPPPVLFLALILSSWVVLSLVYDWLAVRRCRRRLNGGLRRLASEGW